MKRLHREVYEALRYVFKDVADDAEMLRRMESLGAAERAFADYVDGLTREREDDRG